MPKTTEVPGDLREFNKVFEELAFKHSYDQLFHDLLDCMIWNFSLNPSVETSQRLQQTYTLQERRTITQ